MADNIAIGKKNEFNENEDECDSKWQSHVYL